MDERFLFPEFHLLRQLTRQLHFEFPFTNKGNLKEIFDALDDIIVIVDKETVIHYANQAAIRRFGVPPDQLIGNNLYRLMPFPEVKRRWQTILMGLKQSEHFSFIDRGHGKYALSHVIPFRDRNLTNEYYLIFTIESNSSALSSPTIQPSAGTAFEESIKALHETSAEYNTAHRLEYQLRISLALANAATGVSLAEDLSSALNTLCTQACLALEAPAAVVRLYNQHQNTLEIAGSYGLSEEHLRRNFAIPYPPLAHLASEAAPRVIVADLDQSPPTPADQLSYRSQLSTSVIANIVRQNRFLGVLVILIPKVHPPLTKEDLLFVQAIAEQASIAIDRFRLLKIQERRTRELENLVRLGIELREVLTKREVMETLLEKLSEDIYIELGAGYLLEDQHYVLVSYQSKDYQPPEWLAMPPNPGWRDGRPIFFDHFCLSSALLTEGRQDPISWDNICGLAIPLHSPSTGSGVLLLFFPHPLHLSSDDRHKIYLLQEIGNAAFHRAEALEHLEQLVLERTRELSILYEITALLNAPSDVHSSIDQVLENVLSITKSKLVVVHLYDPKTKQLTVYHEKSSLPADFLTHLISLQSEPPWETVFHRNTTYYLEKPLEWTTEASDPIGTIPLTYLGLPIRSKGEVLGVLSLFGNHDGNYSLNDQIILTAIADQLGLTIERARLTAQGEEIAKLEERQRLARDLHDALTQSLYSLTLLTSGYKRSLHHATLEEIHQWMDELNDIAQNALAELRLLLYELRPTALEQDGLHGALKRRLDAVEKRAGIQTFFEVHGSFRLPAEDEEHFYRIAQEALNNALQHARHQSIWVKLESLPDHFKMTIADDGIGFDFDRVVQQYPHSGLNNMISRARQIEAQLSFDTTPGKGTKLMVLKEYNHV
ncbi:MAG: Two component sensor histidine kinase [Anaerolineae bacterium]|jgi:PAS domain S-box-containing protein|nr:MAG: Two component sensor histidine kinase [Anaerolineae bacterium]